MEEQRFFIGPAPAVLYGQAAPRAWLFVHGKHGCKEEAAAFAQTACSRGWQVLSVDLPGHGQRGGGPEALLPWQAVPELQAAGSFLRERWESWALRANSLGAWLSLLAFPEETLEKALFVSPVVDMEALILRMMDWAGVSPERLRAEESIPQTLGKSFPGATCAMSGSTRCPSGGPPPPFCTPEATT